MKKNLLLFFSCMLVCVCTMGQWSNDPAVNNRITPEDMSLYDTEIKTSKDDITYVLFSHPNNNGTVTKLQIIDKDGNLLFPEEGKVISNERTRSYNMVNDLLFVDDDGNALIVVSDRRNASPESDDLSYTLYKVDPTGEMLWGEDGIDLEQGRTNKIEAQMKIVQIENGSYVFAWLEGQSGLQNVHLQHLSKDGDFLWDNGVELKEETVLYTYPFLVNAGNNQVILVYIKGTNKDIYARKIDFDGSSVWSADTRIYRGGFPEIGLHTIIDVIPDNKGGVFVGWCDDRSFTDKESTYVSHVNANGQLSYSAGEEGQRVGYSELRSFAPFMAYNENDNCLYVTWRETSGGQGSQRLMAQRIEMTGELKWGDEGLEITPLEEQQIGHYSIQNAPNGNIAIFYMLSTGNVYPVDSYVTLLNNKGETVWKNEQIAFTKRSSYKSGLESSKLVNNKYWLATWIDDRTIENGEVTSSHKILYAQRINADGTLGASSSTSINQSEATMEDETFKAIPSLIDENTSFIVDNKNQGNVDINIYSLSGKKLATVYSGYMAEGRHEITWNAKSALILKGMYIATLSTSQDIKSTRIILK